MEANHESNDSRWVEERLAALGESGDWHPNSDFGLARLRERRQLYLRTRRRWGLALAVTAATSVSLAAFPVTRAFAGRCLSACVAETSRIFGTDPPNVKIEAGALAPDFTLYDPSGEPVRLSSFRGQAVLLNFWATWCPPCKIEIPWFMQFQRAYGREGLVVLGVSLDEDGWKSVKPYIDSQRVNYRMMVGNDDLIRMYGGLDTLPTTLLLDAKGRIVTVHSGLVPKDVYEKEIQTAIRTAPGTR